ncbi:YmiA family putative membrane protein [Serratia marcescens]|nr:YmiA family putative membrane protein [Serratia marcescens]ELY1862430.1 YmiA family putative membrane protein [Serratia marcescens]MDP8772875.1 YmiA family putative membrane protein [Serratia marcescens]MDP8803280.1 YmiA family putative membrane protein [Serratia marcescens]
MKKFKEWVIRKPWVAVFSACAIFWAVVAVVFAWAVMK